MLIFYTITLLGIAIAFLYLTNFDVLSPSFCIITSFFITSLASNYFYLIYGYTIDIEVYGMIISSLVMFIFSERLVSRNRTIYLSRSTLSTKYKFDYSKLVMMFFLLIGLVTLYLRYDYLIRGGSLYAPNGDFFEIVAKSRICTVFPEKCPTVELSPFLKIGAILSRAIACLLVVEYLYFKATRSTNMKSNIYYFSFIGIYLLQLLFTTSRIGFVYFFIYVFYCWCFFNISGNSNFKKVIIRITKIGIISSTLFLLTFYVLGFFTSKSDDFSISDMLMRYMGLQVLSLQDYLLNSECNGACSSTGSETFYTLRMYLSQMGLGGEVIKQTMPYSIVGTHQINVFTGFRNYINDFGVYSPPIIMSIMGVIYGLMYRYFLSSSSGLIGISLYAFSIYPIFMMPWSDRFSNVYVSNQTILIFILIYILQKFVFNRRC
ncbi:O-antigen polymerase [Vibrio gigantis]|uniref:O-antigen polymerase n=1 Tax=Vibrio gigantis TaxID=296199 RepID=UPI003D0AB6A3